MSGEQDGRKGTCRGRWSSSFWQPWVTWGQRDKCEQSSQCPQGRTLFYCTGRSREHGRQAGGQVRNRQPFHGAAGAAPPHAHNRRRACSVRHHWTVSIVFVIVEFSCKQSQADSTLLEASTNVHPAICCFLPFRLTHASAATINSRPRTACRSFHDHVSWAWSSCRWRHSNRPGNWPKSPAPAPQLEPDFSARERQ